MKSLFHLAYHVTDLDAARSFYGNVLGCREGRSTETWVDFDFFGHQISLHLGRPFEVTRTGKVGDHMVMMPHLGVVLPLDAWFELAARLESAGITFDIPPVVRFKGEPGEQRTMFFCDPSGNPIEVKGFNDFDSVFANWALGFDQLTIDPVTATSRHLRHQPALRSSATKDYHIGTRKDCGGKALTYNLLFWRWSDQYATPSKRKKIRFDDITRGFSECGSHPGMGVADITGFRSAIDDAFGADEDARPFVFEEYSNCVVINYPNAVRFELVPKLASIGKRFGLNASEF